MQVHFKNCRTDLFEVLEEFKLNFSVKVTPTCIVTSLFNVLRDCSQMPTCFTEIFMKFSKLCFVFLISIVRLLSAFFNFN